MALLSAATGSFASDSSVFTEGDAGWRNRPLRVVGDRDYPPFCYLDNGLPAGFDIDVLRAVASVMGLRLDIQLLPWNDAREALQAGAVDIIPGMARIPSREPLFDFTTPTKQLIFDLFVPEDSPIRSMADARDALILVQKGGVIYDLVKQQGNLARMQPVEDAPTAMRQLIAGECEGAIVNRIQAFRLLNEMNRSGIRAVKADLPSIPYCFAVTEGNARLVDILNEGLANIKADGTYDAIYDRWFSVYDRTDGQLLRTVLTGTGIVTLLLLLVGAVNWSLRNQVRSRTAELSQIIDLIPFAIFARDRQGRYILANQTTAQSMGLPVSDIIGRRHAEVHPGDPHLDLYRKEDQQVLENHQAMFIPEARVHDRHGHPRIVQVSKIPFRHRDGVPTSVLCVVLDITELKQAEEALRASRENLMIILNSIADGVIATDADGRVVSMNPVAETMTGQLAREALGLKLGQVLNLSDTDGERQPVDEIMRLALQDGERTGLAHQLSLESRDGTIRDVSLNWSPIRKENERYAGLVLVLRDVTEENRLTHRLNETQKMESIGRLAGGVAHDFNNLLAGIFGSAELLGSRLDDRHPGRPYLNNIFEASERARDLVQQLLAFSRRTPRDIKPVDLHTVIGHFVSLLQHTLDRRITITQHLNATSYAVLGDRTQLQNALLNLGVNARDAMPNGGNLTIITRNITLTPADCERNPYPIRPGPFVEVSVTDTGIGMDRETMHHIFEPFFTTKGKMGGTGLGLAAVYGTVKDHGGYIDVSSKPGHGTTFILGVPVTDTALPASTDTAPGVERARIPGIILIVDDEDIVLRTTREILTSIGYRTLTATNGNEAVALFRERGNEIHLVILDMIMPGLSGEETFRELKSINSHVRAIISSGFMQDHRMDSLTELGVVDFMQKPFRKNELAAKVANALRLPPSPAG
ncbi:MAG TPA: transporter substrate-binding domain-containing protein [Kiritimatiellia bacterium]|nr:transporter substrate-binding domain-containing protein [Kiritimatiellia bacterium]HMP32948.1 transporter substrate-binding domain-containing protein [Kiritimatiellia bacterium]